MLFVLEDAMACEVCGGATECDRYQATVRLPILGRPVGGGTEITYSVHEVSGDLCVPCIRRYQAKTLLIARACFGVIAVGSLFGVVAQPRGSAWILLVISVALLVFAFVRNPPPQAGGPGLLHDTFLKRLEARRDLSSGQRRAAAEQGDAADGGQKSSGASRPRK
jgi:hypothetical protein